MKRPQRPCRYLGCHALHRTANGYCEAHQGESTWKHKESSSERGYGAMWRRLRRQVLMRDGGICRCDECTRLGRIRVAEEVDHKVPKFLGGTDSMENLQAIAKECHKAKSQAEAKMARKRA